MTRAHEAAEHEATDRSRTYSWQDPAPALAALGSRPGSEVLAAMLARQLPAPPVMATLGIEAEVFEEGRAVFSLVPAEFHYNPLGSVHGGVIATLLDSAAGCAVHSVLPAGTGYTSLDLVTKYLRPVTVATGRVSVEGRVLSRGSRTALAEARLTDADDRLLAHATSTCLLFRLDEG
jgi:uncharacterized protein (TIGR00369 family)